VTRASLLFAVTTLLAPNARAAEPPASAERFSASLSERAGLAEAPFVTTAFPEVSGFASVLSGTVRVNLPPLAWTHITLPVGIVRLDFPAGAQEPVTALGNLELGLERALEVHWATHLAFEGALIAPTASSSSKSALLANRALALASSLRGGKDAALLTPGVLGVRARATLEHFFEPFALRASLDLPLLFRVSDASLPEESETHAAGVSPALDLEGAVWLSRWFGASLGGGLIFEALRVQEPALEVDRDRRLQPLVEPGVKFRLGRHVELGLGAAIPVGGTLGGDAWSVALDGKLEL
jgi:hypothetical protein